jgi:polar amino acid transport system permease protein
MGNFFLHCARHGHHHWGNLVAPVRTGARVAHGARSSYGEEIQNRIAAAYSLLMRGVPGWFCYLFYFILSGRLVNLSPLWAGSLSWYCGSAYQMEFYRNAAGSRRWANVAARAIGMSRLQSIQYIILPQALRLAIPPWSNEASIVLKDSSLVYALGVPEILRRSQQLSATTQQPFLAYGTAALIYFVLVFATNRALDYLSERTKLPTHP